MIYELILLAVKLYSNTIVIKELNSHSPAEFCVKNLLVRESNIKIKSVEIVSQTEENCENC